MLKESKKKTLPTAEIRPANGVQNGVQNDRIGLSWIGLDTVGLPAKSLVFTPEKGLKTSDSDLRLHIKCL